MNFTHASSGKKATKNPDETVDRYVIKNYPTFMENQDIFEAVKTLISKKLTGAPVVDKKGFPVGFLSEKDCLRLALDAKYYNMPPGIISDYMSRSVLCVQAGTNIFEVIELFTQHQFHAYPVVKNKKLVGVIERSGALKVLQRMKGTFW